MILTQREVAAMKNHHAILLLAALATAGCAEETTPVDTASASTEPAPSSSTDVNDAKAIDSRSCDGQIFDHALYFHYPESGANGCVGWNEGAAQCRYFDNWDGSRRGTTRCAMDGDELVLEGFPYAFYTNNTGGASMSLTFTDVDLERNCFDGYARYDWHTSHGFGIPREESRCS